MRPRLERTAGHDQVESDQDGISLLVMIEKIVCGVEEYLQETMYIVMDEKMLHMLWQNTNVENNVTVLEAYAGRITVPPTLVDDNLRELYPSLSDLKNVLLYQHDAETEAAKEQYLACMLFVGTTNAKFGNLKDDLSNSYLLGDDQYPKNMEGIVSLLKNWKGYRKQNPTTTNTTTVQEEVAFLQNEADSDAKNGKRVNAAGEEQCH